ncbi:hypothetical protein BVC93_17275 [Mycobacterium sp. MS1601]|uniref:hypothetical protein n=1 Tax=Mycobacterium sp. MS1601 TaxID=1936029 RepID=UPI0009796360|nr:hypothetical protein [Mycobacterium sp. MS1601]AQA03890.1 hypothetical protein BVC93_17275 [Mycobacterium sp. MS1601]
MKLRSPVTALVVASGAVGLIMTAPAASAEPDQPSCTNAGNIVSGTSTVCQSPGNAQLTTSPGELGETQWGMWPWGGGIGVL